MKTVFIVRHAKSDWGDPALDDHDRPLNARGRHDAPAMGRRLAARGVVPDLILSSTALRARTTAAALAAAFDLEPGASVLLDATLYAASTSHLLETIRGLDDAVGAVMLVGHNPESSGLVHRLTGEAIDLPTCAVAEVALDVAHWADVHAGGLAGAAYPGTLVRLDTPKG
ncbi:histidine phosphatase family protein [Agromyces intestinalis]|uniref:Histidine phosphatase family protein n=1 Tax=Agromyces intestinalis TaxID=2592652 RepID=A0A5C1YIF1_9MICO|nr:histidine phosphatase family protein [Agromyces intestinalis]QEO14827.1 histidine phosphatase family protein [Agromyces intestinalis]